MQEFEAFIPISNKMYEYVIEKISKEYPGRYEIVFHDEETVIIKDCKCISDAEDYTPSNIAVRYKKLKNPWDAEFKLRQDYFRSHFPRIEIPVNKNSLFFVKEF